VALLSADAVDFLEAIKIEQNLSPNTVSSYRRNLEQFFSWLLQNDLPLTIDKLHPLILRKYIVFLKNEVNNSNNSIKQKIATLKSFFNHLKSVSEDISIPHIPSHIKKERKPIKTLSQAEVRRLLDAVINRKNNIEASLSKKPRYFARLKKQLLNCTRDLSILSLLVGTGIRVAELSSLNLSDINFLEKTVLIHGKRSKLREVFFDIPSIEAALSEYYNWRISINLRHDAFFINSKDSSRITPRSIQRLLKIYLEIASLPSDITPHSLRHSYASISIEKGANIKAISQLLGHSHVGTTLEFYTHLSKEYLRLVFKETHPDTDQTVSLKQAMENRKKILTSL